MSYLTKRVIPLRRYVLWSSFGAAFGGVYGLTLGRMAASREYIRLEGSPLATEARYQLHKLNPSHPFLRGFENEMNEWENYQQSEQYSDNDDDNAFDDRMFDRNSMQISKYDQPPMNESTHSRLTDRRRREPNGYQNYSSKGSKEMNGGNKRNKFYQGRKQLNGNSFDDVSEDVGDFFENSQHG